MKKIMLIGLGAFMFLAIAVLAVIFVRQRSGPLMLSAPPEHGTAFVIEADFSRMSGATDPQKVLKEALENRVSALGIRMFVESPSASRLRLAVPVTQSNQVDAVRKAITRQGNVALRLVNDDSDTIIKNGDPIPPGYELLRPTGTGLASDGRLESVIAKKEAEPGLAGNIVKTAMVERDPMGRPDISFVLKEGSVTAFADATRKNIRRRLAIVIDGELYSAPVIESPIESGSGQITGQFGLEEASALVAALDNPLPTAVKIVQVDTLGTWPAAFSSTPTNWPAYTGELSGPVTVRIRNPNEFKVRVGLRSNGKGRDFMVEPNGVESIDVPAGRYEVYFNYSSNPGGLFQGDSLTLRDESVEITITRVVNGNYGIRRVE